MKTEENCVGVQILVCFGTLCFVYMYSCSRQLRICCSCIVHILYVHVIIRAELQYSILDNIIFCFPVDAWWSCKSNRCMTTLIVILIYCFHNTVLINDITSSAVDLRLRCSFTTRLSGDVMTQCTYVQGCNYSVFSVVLVRLVPITIPLVKSRRKRAIIHGRNV